MNENNVSFIMPTRNTVHYTKMAYESLRKYNPNSEIIILDDLSNDGTIEYLQSIDDKNLVKWYNDPIIPQNNKLGYIYNNKK